MSEQISEQQASKADANPGLPQFMAEEIDRNPNGTLAQAYKQSNGNLHDLLQIADRQGMISQLPASMQGLVQEYQREQQKARSDEDGFQRRLATALGATVVAMSASANAEAYVSGESAPRNYTRTPPSSAEFAAMSNAERLAYYEQRQNTTLDQWAALSQNDRAQHHQLDVQAGSQGITNYADKIIELNREMKKNISQDQIDIVTSVGNVLDSKITSDTSPAGLKKQEELLKQRAAELARQNPNIPAHYFERYAEYQHGVLEQSALEDAGNAGLRANKNNDVSTSHQQQTTAAQIGAVEEQRKQAKTLDKRDDLDRQVTAIMAAGTHDEVNSAALKAQQENQQTLATSDAATIAASKKPQAQDEFSNDAPAASQQASAPTEATRPKTIAADALGPNGKAGLALLGAQEVAHVAPEAANDPKAIQPVQAKPASAMGGIG